MVSAGATVRSLRVTHDGTNEKILSVGNDTEGISSSDSNDTTTATTEGVLTTRPLPFDANSSLMATALSQDLNLTTASVSVECCDEQGGRRWIMEFYSGGCLDTVGLARQLGSPESFPIISIMAEKPPTI